jgi:CRP-like cAMP-binding protein
MLTKIIEEFEPISCIKNSFVCQEGQELDYIYFIREGEFEISKVVRMGAK